MAKCANRECPKEVLRAGELCEQCQAERDWLETLESTLDAVDQATKKHGWQLDRKPYKAKPNTRSRVYEVSRIIQRPENESQASEGLDPDNCYVTEMLLLTISDEGDLDLEAFEEVLARPPKPWD